jgi:hypothetical protein
MIVTTAVRRQHENGVPEAVRREGYPEIRAQKPGPVGGSYRGIHDEKYTR